MAVSNLVKRIQQKMRQDAGINGDAQRIEQMVWIFFLKVYDAQEYEWEIDAMDKGEEYKSIIPEDLRWRNWAPSKDEDGKIKSDFLTGERLLKFVDNVLFPVLKGEDIMETAKEGEKAKVKYKGVHINRDSERHEAIVQEVFNEVNQYMKNGQLLRDVIDIVDEVDMLDNEDIHAFGDIYESILRDVQSAGNAGEFYTPRPVTDFTIEMINPRLGEKMGDLASGTCGFVVSALNYLAKQKKTAKDEEDFQKSVMGQEWKPFPYLLGVTNVILHGIKEPEIYHMDSLSHPMSDYQEEGKLHTIAMNPPFGGATDAATSKNFKQEYRSSETADLFMVLIMQRLAENGRAGVVLPDGFLFGTDGPKFAIKKRLLTEFNLHTIVRLPTSVFAPYTSIATNILFFDNKPADDAPEGFATKETWFYRLDMPEGYKHFSKTKPIRLEHFDPVRAWWKDRRELDGGEKSRAFTPQELIDLQCNFDQCKFPKEEEDILTPQELMTSYLERSEECYRQIKDSFANILNRLHDKNERREIPKPINNPWQELAEISATLPGKLKKSILQDAIMSKLGTQDPNDEPVSVLLGHIREEKKRLVKEGKLKKKDLEETPVEESEQPFKIPESWEWVRVGFVADYINGLAFKPEDWELSGMPIIRIQNLSDINKPCNYTSKTFDEKFKVYNGDLLFSWSATLDSFIWEGETAWLNQHIFKVVQYTGVYKKYLFYALKGLVTNLSFITHGLTMKHLTRGVFEEYPFALPPLAEQHRIVEKIEALFREIDNMRIENDINETETKETEND